MKDTVDMDIEDLREVIYDAVYSVLITFTRQQLIQFVVADLIDKANSVNCQKQES